MADAVATQTLIDGDKKVVVAIVADVFGRAAVTNRSGSAAFSSAINLTCTSVCTPILISYRYRWGVNPTRLITQFERTQ